MPLLTIIETEDRT